MFVLRATTAIALLMMYPFAGVAETDVVSRRDGFLHIWETIHRPAEPAWSRFEDVPESAQGSLEIDYAAARAIIDDDTPLFRPNDPLLLGDALIWLLRTRNVTDDPTEVSIATLPSLLERFPIADVAESQKNQHQLSSAELSTLVRLLDGQLAEQEHEVSLYAEKFHGKGTAFGEKFDMHALTAAHRSLPHNTLVRVTNVSNGKSVVVRINDRGPFVSGRDMDLSLAAFTAIEDRSRGKFMARFERLGDVSLVEHTCADSSLVYRRISSRVHLRQGIPASFPLGDDLILRSDQPFVLRGMTYPDGTMVPMQNFILPGESFSFTPAMSGTYDFVIGTATGRRRTIQMNVHACDSRGV